MRRGEHGSEIHVRFFVQYLFIFCFMKHHKSTGFSYFFSPQAMRIRKCCTAICRPWLHYKEHPRQTLKFKSQEMTFMFLFSILFDIFVFR
jgi:hypothetical protein